MAHAGEAATAELGEEERYMFDLNGFLHLKNVLSSSEVKAANQAIDANIDQAQERSGVLRNTRLRTPLAGDGCVLRAHFDSTATDVESFSASVFAVIDVSLRVQCTRQSHHNAVKASVRIIVFAPRCFVIPAAK